MNEKAKLVVIGGGAAGFFCAINAARSNPDLDVTILEKTSKVLSKVKVSGGGRCNVTHASFEIGEMIKNYPRGANFLKKCFHQFFTTDTIRWFEERGVRLKTEPDGRMFPVTDTSQTIVDCLMHEVNKYHVQLIMNADVKRLKVGKSSFMIELSGGRELPGDYVCVACGGFNKLSMFGWLRELGHQVQEPVPSLFTFNLPGHRITQLMGISVPAVQVKIIGAKQVQTGPMLITHWGLSGPAVLRLSAWGARDLAASGWQFGISINWISALNEIDLREKVLEMRQNVASQKIFNKNGFGLPQRLWQFLCEESGVTDSMRWADLPLKVQNQLVKNCCNYEIAVKGKTTFKEEFVTAGGIQLNEIDPNTMQSRIVPNLFFAGEVMDVDGITGGFNFQHAWTSGWIAARAISMQSLARTDL